MCFDNPMSADDAIEELIAQPQRLHWTEAGLQNWRIGPDVLRWLADHVQRDWRTLETGCGHTSIVFALRGARHTIVAPHGPEHDLVREWCAKRGFSTDNVTSVVRHSQNALPGLDCSSLDLALIDGGHAFPVPFIDFYYIAERLKVGGQLLVDDLHIPTCRLLHDFLVSEAGRWRLEIDFDGAAMFSKTSEVLIPLGDWTEQPFNQPHESRPSPRAGLRGALRPRTRLRALVARARPDR